MNLTTYQHADDFLARTYTELAANEVFHSLPLGIVLRLQKFPERIETPPYLATVEEEGKLVMAAIMTPPFRLIVASDQTAEFGEAPALLIQDLRTHGWNVPGVMGPSHLSDLLAHAWSGITGEIAHLRTHERLFELTQVRAPRPGPGMLRLASPDETKLVSRWVKAFQAEATHNNISDAEALNWAVTRIGNGEIYFWVLPDGSIVSLAGTTRPVAHTISVGPVYTPPELRGHGYASRCVAALSQQLLDHGWQRCSLFTDLSNPTSNSIYQQIGYQAVCDFQEYDFLRV